MRRPALLASVLLCLLAAPALAHEGDPNYESVVTRVEGAPGLRAQVLNGDDRLLLINTGSETVVVEGYDGEPYARLRPDGTVEVNRRSSATYLNEERFGGVPIPAEADPDAEPAWRPVGRNGRFEFHDHRIHWMVENRPPKIADEEQRQKVFDWTVPLRVGDAEGAVAGTLWWVGRGGDAPVAAYAGGGALVLLSFAALVVVRRRRARAAAPADGPREEAW
jgi:hypothetical protein